MPISLKTSGGGNFAFGIKPPEASKSFKEVGNTSYSGSSGLDSEVDRPVDKGRVAPVPGSVYRALAMPVRTYTKAPMALGNWPMGGSIWANTPNTGVYDNTSFMGGFYMDDTSLPGSIYSLNGIGSTQFSRIYKTDVVDGGITLFRDFPDVRIRGDSRPFIYPVNKLDPENSDWVIVYQNVYDLIIYALVVYPDSTTSAEIPLKVDSSFSNQSFRHNGGYLTEDGTILMSNIGSLIGYDGLSFKVTRGSATHTVNYGIDSSASSFSPAYEGNTLGLEYITVLPWGQDSVIILADASLAGSQNFVGLYGRRILDRPDFDRWLNDICDFHGLPDSENFLPALPLS
jgi:hypothetical protein